MKKVLLLFIFVIVHSYFVNAQDLIIGSYNIRNDNSDDKVKGNGWERRCPLIVQQILFNDFDFLGAQEVFHNQLEDLLYRLPRYGYVGVGRDDGKTSGEYSPIFYKKNRFRNIKSGHFWLSEQPEIPGTGWDAAYPRICIYGQFKDLVKNKNVWVFNLHFDHIGVEARKQSAQLVMRKIKEMCSNDAVILMGDFNVDQTNESYMLFAESKILHDTYETAEVCYALNGSFNAFRSERATNSRIDHIFVSDKFKVDRFGVLTDSYRTPKDDNKLGIDDFPENIYAVDATVRLLSDHFPIKATLYYRK